MWQSQFCREPSSKFPAHHSPTFHLLPLSCHLLSWQVSAGCWQETPAPCYKTSPECCLNVLMMWQLTSVEKRMPEREQEGAPFSFDVLISHTPSFLPHSVQRKWVVWFSPQPKGRRIRLHLWRKADRSVLWYLFFFANHDLCSRNSVDSVKISVEEKIFLMHFKCDILFALSPEETDFSRGGKERLGNHMEVYIENFFWYIFIIML